MDFKPSPSAICCYCTPGSSTQRGRETTEDTGTKSTEKESLEVAAMMEFVHLAHIIILDLDKWLEL